MRCPPVGVGCATGQRNGRRFPRLVPWTSRHLVAGAVLVALVASACGGQPQSWIRNEEEIAIPVAAYPVQAGSVRTVVHAGGIVVPQDGAEFFATPPEPARVIEVPVAEGSAVSSGQMLVRFELPTAAQEVARWRAELARVQAQFENARISHARVSDFVARGLVPRRDIDAADRELADARVEVDRTEAALAAAEAAVERAVVRAPFDGVLVQRFYSPGDLVQSTLNPVVRVVNPDRLDVKVFIPANQISRVLPGATARLASPVSAQPVHLTVAPALQSLRPGADGTYQVRLTFTDPTTLAVDTRVEVDIDAEERNDVVFLPPEAVVRDGDETVVFVAAGDRAERRVVTIGLSDLQRVEITSGLQEGELVVTRGQLNLIDGSLINVVVGN
jgi:RND family efflux transporter MFP subunit